MNYFLPKNDPVLSPTSAYPEPAIRPFEYSPKSRTLQEFAIAALDL